MSVFSTKNLEQEDNTKLKKHTILLVDDEPGNLIVMSSLLAKICHVLTAQSGAEAIELLSKHSNEELSMIISDQRMPGMLGTELLEKSIATHPDALRLIVSGYCDLNAVLSAINQARIYHFVTKPFENQDFLYTIQQALNTYDFKQGVQKELLGLKQQLNHSQQQIKLKEEALAKAHEKLKNHGIAID